MRVAIALALLALSTGCIEDSTEPATEREPAADAGQIGGGDADGGEVPTDAAPEPLDARPLRDAEPEPIDASAPEPMPDAARPQDPCDAVCERATDCLDVPAAQCQRLCQQLPRAVRQCVLNAPECAGVAGCLEGPEPQPPGPQEICTAVCERQAGCVALDCAPGTLPDGWRRQCQRDCEANPPAQESLQALFGGLCADVVDALRADEPEIDAACEAPPEAWCRVLCDDRLLSCDEGIDVDACAAACESEWNDTNLACVQRADTCDDLDVCFGDPEGQLRCEATCDYLQACLLEACPPRSIPPILTTQCAAGCLQSPPPQADVDQYLALECSQVRQLVYRNTPELRPLCEGGREFRPSPDECVAFCDNALEGCLGVGGRAFCLAGCASLTREEYGCALEAQGDCAAIDRCLPQ